MCKKLCDAELFVKRTCKMPARIHRLFNQAVCDPFYIYYAQMASICLKPNNSNHDR